MKTWFEYSLNKRNGNGLVFHYLRVGKTTKIFDDLKASTEQYEIEWKLHETDSFLGQYFGTLYEDVDGSIINLEVNEENLVEFRKDFWENYVWKTRHTPIVTAFIIPNSETPGSLTKSQIFDLLSLNRLNDRAFELFELGKEDMQEITSWLVKMTAIVHKKPRKEEEEEE